MTGPPNLPNRNVTFRNNSCTEEYSVSDGGAIHIEAYYGYIDCVWRVVPCTFNVGSGLVVESNFVLTKMDPGLCNTYIMCPFARGGGIYIVGDHGNTVHLGDNAVIRDNYGEGWFAYGGGIYIMGEGHNVTAGRNLTIAGNVLQGVALGIGGGLYMDRTCRKDCWFCSTYCFEGGSTFIVGDGLRIDHNVNNGNVGGGAYTLFSTFVAGAHASVSHNSVIEIPQGPNIVGAGFATSRADIIFGSHLTVRDNSFNVQNGWREVYGGCLFVSGASFTAGDHMTLATSTGSGTTNVFGNAALIERGSSFVAGDYLSVVDNTLAGAEATILVSFDSSFITGRSGPIFACVICVWLFTSRPHTHANPCALLLSRIHKTHVLIPQQLPHQQQHGRHRQCNQGDRSRPRRVRQVRKRV